MIYIKDIQLWIYLFFIFISFILSAIFFDISTFYGSAVALFVPLLIRIFSLKETRELQEFKKMGINNILEHRDDESEYRKRISNIKKELLIMGHTAKRFIEDFGDIEGRRDEKKTLLSLLSNDKKKVKILIADKDYLNDSKQSHFKNTLETMKKIRKKYPNFEVKYYQHLPTHSIFLFDENCLIGPIFDNLESKDTPTIVAKKNSPFVKDYLEYFDSEWSEAISIDDKN